MAASAATAHENTAARPDTAPVDEYGADEYEPGEYEAGEQAGGPVARDDDPEARARQVCLRLLTLAPRDAGAARRRAAQAGHPRRAGRGGARPVRGRRADRRRRLRPGLGGIAAPQPRPGRTGAQRRADAARGGGRRDPRGHGRAARPEAEVTAARRLVDGKLRSTRGLPAEQRTRRLAGLLARKGYPAGLAFRVIREALEAEGEAAPLEDEPSFDGRPDPDGAACAPGGARAAAPAPPGSRVQAVDTVKITGPHSADNG